MAFTPIKKGAWGTALAASEVRVVATSSQLGVFIPTAILKQLGSPAYVTAAQGTGSDAGWILLEPAATSKGAYKVCNKSANSARKIGISGKAVGIPKGVSVKTMSVGHFYETSETGVSGLCINIAPVLAAAKAQFAHTSTRAQNGAERRVAAE